LLKTGYYNTKWVAKLRYFNQISIPKKICYFNSKNTTYS